MANTTWLWLEKRLLWLIKISTFLSRFRLEIPNLGKFGQQKFWPSRSPALGISHWADHHQILWAFFDLPFKVTDVN
jgi:hypothetical protein